MANVPYICYANQAPCAGDDNFLEICQNHKELCRILFRNMFTLLAVLYSISLINCTKILYIIRLVQLNHDKCIKIDVMIFCSRESFAAVVIFIRVLCIVDLNQCMFGCTIAATMIA